jgi:hypothetical protein
MSGKISKRLSNHVSPRNMPEWAKKSENICHCIYRGYTFTIDKPWNCDGFFVSIHNFPHSDNRYSNNSGELFQWALSQIEDATD